MNFDFLSPPPSPPSPIIQNLQSTSTKSLLVDPLGPPLITLDDYSIDAIMDTSSHGYHRKSAIMPTTPTKIQKFSHHHFISDDSDSDGIYPPISADPSEVSSAAISEASSAVASEASFIAVSEVGSAVVSESDVLSGVASESDLLPLPKTKKPVPKSQVGILDFFPVLSESDIQAQRAKRKRVDPDEEAKQAEDVKRVQERKLAKKRERNRISQQKHQELAKKAEIKQGKRDSQGNLIKWDAKGNVIE